jgi:hypothetical protein
MNRHYLCSLVNVGPEIIIAVGAVAGGAQDLNIRASSQIIDAFCIIVISSEEIVALNRFYNYLLHSHCLWHHIGVGWLNRWFNYWQIVLRWRRNWSCIYCYINGGILFKAIE